MYLYGRRDPLFIHSHILFLSLSLLRSRFVGEFLQFDFDFVVGEKRLIGGMCNSERIPISQDGRPRLKETREDVELEYRHVVVAREIDRRFESDRFQIRVNLMNAVEIDSKFLPRDDDSKNKRSILKRNSTLSYLHYD